MVKSSLCITRRHHYSNNRFDDQFRTILSHASNMWFSLKLVIMRVSNSFRLAWIPQLVFSEIVSSWEKCFRECCQRKIWLNAGANKVNLFVVALIWFFIKRLSVNPFRRFSRDVIYSNWFHKTLFVAKINTWCNLFFIQQSTCIGTLFLFNVIN